ncbi:unnamed protein product, partial [Closterium sp. Naga37s-1]
HEGPGKKGRFRSSASCPSTILGGVQEQIRSDSPLAEAGSFLYLLALLPLPCCQKEHGGAQSRSDEGAVPLGALPLAGLPPGPALPAPAPLPLAPPGHEPAVECGGRGGVPGHALLHQDLAAQRRAAAAAHHVGVTFVDMWGYVLLWRLVVLAIAGKLSSTTTPSYLPFSLAAALLVFAVVSVALEVAVALLSRLLAPFIISVVRKVIVTVSFGLSPKELSFASVFVDECLHLGPSSHHVEHWNVQKLLALAKTRSLRGELMAGYEDDKCDMGKAVFREGLLEERVPQEGVTGKGVAAEGLIGEGKVEEGKEQEEVEEREVRVRRQGEGDERVGAEGAESAGIASIQTSVSRPQQGSCMHTAEPLDSRTGLSGTHLGLGEAVESFGAAQQQMVAAAGEEGGQGRAPGSVRRSLSRFRRRVTARRFTEQALRQGGERGEGGEEMGEEGGESKEGQARGGGSAAEGVGFATRRGGVGEAPIEGASEEVKGKQQQRGTEEKGVRPGHEGQLKTTEVQHGSGRQQRVSARGSREERVAYEFLWNDGALEAAASECEMYKLLRPQLQAITHNPGLSDQECVRQVKQLCVMIEERFGELTGQFDLNHGAYFLDPRIIGAMVHFLGHRELPDWSREIDTDVLRAEERIRFGRLGHRGAGA